MSNNPGIYYNPNFGPSASRAVNNPATPGHLNPWIFTRHLNNVGQWYPYPGWGSNQGQGFAPAGQWFYGPSNFGFNAPGFGYGNAYGFGPLAGIGPGFNYGGGYGFGQGWGNVGQGFTDGDDGPYTGVGPRNFRRSDARIAEDVCDELTADSHLNAHDVEVKVQNGIVSLSGTVPSNEMRRRAEEDADSILGVVNVQNDLKVSQGSASGSEAHPQQIRSVP